MAEGSRPKEPTFFGEPVALGYLAFTEAWERFSYYGMGALVALSMTQALFLPGRIEHGVGVSGLRGGIEAVTGPLSNQGLASMMGWVGSLYERLTPAAFWGLDAAIAGVGAVLILIMWGPLARRAR